MHQFKLEKGQKYRLTHYDDYLEGEFLGVMRKTCGNHSHLRLVFKTGEKSFWTAEPETRISQDGTITITYDCHDYKSSLEALLNPPPRPQETAELI